MTATTSGKIRYGHLEALIGFQLRRAFLHSNQLFARLIGDLRLAPGHLGVLTLIFLNPGRLQREIADAAGLDRSTLTQMLDQLSMLGLVERRPGPDRRSVSLFLTRSGVAARKSAQARAREHERLLRGPLNDEEADTLLSLLTRLNDGAQ